MGDRPSEGRGTITARVNDVDAGGDGEHVRRAGTLPDDVETLFICVERVSTTKSRKNQCSVSAGPTVNHEMAS
jgi:hypothetical protein